MCINAFLFSCESRHPYVDLHRPTNIFFALYAATVLICAFAVAVLHYLFAVSVLAPESAGAALVATVASVGALALLVCLLDVTIVIVAVYVVRSRRYRDQWNRQIATRRVHVASRVGFFGALDDPYEGVHERAASDAKRDPNALLRHGRQV